MQNPPRIIVLDPKLFDVTGRAAPIAVELPPVHVPTQADRDREWSRRYDALLRGREWARDDR